MAQRISIGYYHPAKGAQLEVYDDEVIFRPVNCLAGRWYTNSAYTFELV